MKQRIKRIFLALLACLSFAVLLPAPARAAAGGEELKAVVQLAEQNLLAIVAFDDETIQQYIADFESMDLKEYEPLAEGLKSWAALKAEAGGFVAVDRLEPKETEDGYFVEAFFRCEKREAVASFGFLRENGRITRLSFEKVQTLPEKLGDAAFNLLIGMGTVFLVLIFIAFLISRFKYINSWVNAREARRREEESYEAAVRAAQRMPAVATDVSKRISPAAVRAALIPEGAKAELIEGEPAAPEGELSGEMLAVLSAAVAASSGAGEAQLIAVITAAVMAAQGDGPGPDGLVVRSIRRVSPREEKSRSSSGRV